MRRVVAKVTGLTRAQTTRLIAQPHKTGRIEDRRRGATRPFERRYRAADIAEVDEVDEVDETLGGLVRTGHPAGDVAPIRGLWR